MEFLGEEMDINYRAALEVSRGGELEVTVPYLTVSTTDPIPTIPKSAPKEIISRYEKLVSLYKHLITVKDYGPEDLVAGNDEEEGEREYSKPCYLLQVRIKYALPPAKGKYAGGIVFRRPSHFSSLLDKQQNPGQDGGKATPAAALRAQCMYTTHHTSGSLYDLDGVRCWLPCIDALDQRAVFDVSVTALSNLSVMCSGVKVSSVHHTAATAAQSAPHLKTSRFFGNNRVPACRLGLFVGGVESYKMPLYKVRGRIWVATGLADYASRDGGSGNGGAGKSKGGEGEVEFIKRVNHPVGGGGGAKVKRRFVAVKSEGENAMAVVSEEESTAPLRSGGGGGGGEEEGRSKRARVEGGAEGHSSGVLPASGFTAPAAGSSSSSGAHSNRLYEALVHHSTLGLDMALRLVHKFTSRRYDYAEIGIIYVHDLGAPAMTFDGFLLLDAAASLYGELSVFQETSAHLQLLEAYLYSWLGTALAVNCFDSEYILHGAVAYVLNYYIDSIYGEDEYRYYYQKQYDAVIALEKFGKGCTLSRFYPETYSQFSASRGSYVLNKSSVLFQLLENKIANGRDPMRIILKQLIHSPALYIAKETPASSSSGGNPAFQFSYLGSQDFNSQDNSPVRQGSLSPATPSLDLSPYNSGNYSPTIINTPGGGTYSPYAGSYAGQQSPYAARAGSQSPYAYGGAALGGQSPYVVPQGSMSPYSYGGGGQRGRGGSFDYSTSAIYSQYSPRNYELSPYVQHEGGGGAAAAGTEGGGGRGYQSALAMPVLTRQNSDSSVYSKGGQTDAGAGALICEVITPEVFLSVLRNASGVSSDIDDSFLDRYVHDSGVLFVKLHVHITDKIETQPRHIHLTTRTIGYSQGSHMLNQRAVRKQALKCRLAEVRDDIVTEPMLTLSGEAKEEFVQQAYSRPGRRGGKRRGLKDDEQDPELGPEQLAERARREQEKEMRKSALQLVRDIDYPVRYAIVDPSCLEIVDLSHCTSHVGMLVEQLYTDLYEHSVHFQCQAIRNLALCNTVIGGGSSVLSAPSALSSAPENTMLGLLERIPKHKLQLRALANVLLGLSTSITDSKLLNSTQMSVYIRGEAAFALAAHQNAFAPINILVDPNVTLGSGAYSWDASTILCNCCVQLFCDPATQRPLPNDFTNESFTYLRNATLLALSSIRSQSNHTPAHVTRLLLLFTQYLEDATYVTVEDEAGTAASFSSVAAAASINYDDTHYKAVLYLVLSRLRMENTVKSLSPETTDTMSRLSILITDSIASAYTQARALSRIRHQSGQANQLPELPGGGIDIAAAITALSELDVEAVHMYVKGKALLQPPVTDASGKLQPQRLRDYEYHQPSGVGCFTGFNYKRYFLPPSAVLRCNMSEESITGSRAAPSLKDDITYCLSSPAVRLAAFEAYVRINFSLHVGQMELFRNSPAYREGKSVKESTFIAASIEALDSILKRSDYSQASKQQCAQIFADVVQDRGARVAVRGISVGSPWNCMGWSDAAGLTQPLSQRSFAVEHRAAMNTVGEYMRVALKLLWRVILNSAACDQVIRSTLLEAWIHAYGRKIPVALRIAVQGSVTNPDAEVPALDRFFENKLPLDRLRIASVQDAGSSFEKAFQQPLVAVKASKAAAAAAAASAAAPVHDTYRQPPPLGATAYSAPMAAAAPAAGEQSLRLSLSLGGLRGKTADDGKAAQDGFKFVL